ncbi:MAG: hypothetical protein GC180_02675 [Bacteroidetes bacterium]|nr:hypothetical protein [Bacteroidota bacterium]
MDNTPVLLVPTDFTAVGDSAVLYAQELAKILNANITLLHVVAKDSETAAAKNSLNAIASKLESLNIGTKCIVDKGNIFDEIGRVAKLEDASFIIMGTHGDKGMQKVFGSRALKVITNSETPFIVVHRKPMAAHGFKNIVMPLSMDQEVKQTIHFATSLGKYFQSKIHILYVEESDEFFKNKIARNIPAAEAILKERGFEYEITSVSKKHLAENLINYANDVQADLIAFLNNHENFATYLGGSFEQTLISNSKEIPVMVINSISAKTNSLMGHMMR